MTEPTAPPDPELSSVDPIERRKFLMRLSSLNGAAVANALGLSEGAVSQVVNGNHLQRPAAARIMAFVAQYLDRSVDDLWPERRAIHPHSGETP